MNAPHRSSPQLLVLHTLRCFGAASTQRLAEALQPITDVDVEATALDLAARDLVTHDRSPFGGWRITGAGRAADTAQIAAELDHSGARAEVQAAYDDFLPLNTSVLQICSDWQVRSTDPVVLNDHTDRVYDGRVLSRLAGAHRAAQPLCERLAARLTRFEHYVPRLAGALQRARDGELEYVADSLDSFHAVWFQLHEDLLVTLGLSRGAETAR